MLNTTFANITTELAVVAKRLRRNTVKVRNGSSGGGSGVIWRRDGLIITNAHVATSNRVTVELWDGQLFTATRVSIDPTKDLAALKIAASNLPAATIGNSDAVRVGELLFAVGNPFADSGAVTSGILHANHQRTITADIRLFPGNSGGPLADCMGRVIGINTMIAYGLAVAIPSLAVERFLQNHHHVTEAL
jgi:serine protease Do